MEKAKFVYITFIQTTPEKVWQALIDPEMTKDYWGRQTNISTDWAEGSAWQHKRYDEPDTVDIVGQVIESQPPRRLVLSWAAPQDAGNAAKTSRVTFEIDPYMDGSVRLTVTHDELEPGSQMERGITQGWPPILSSLKTLLETGQAMPMTTKSWTKRREDF